jgi:hypothetical protein
MACQTWGTNDYKKQTTNFFSRRYESVKRMTNINEEIKTEYKRPTFGGSKTREEGATPLRT